MAAEEESLRLGGSDARTLRALFAHDLAQSLSALHATVQSAQEICAPASGVVAGNDLEVLKEHLQSLCMETEAQLFQAMMLLWSLMPGIAIGLERPQFESLDVMRLLREMASAYDVKARRRGIRVIFDSNDDAGLMPPIYVEVNTIRRVFHNALSNALKYSYSGGDVSSRYIRIWCKRHDARGLDWAVRIQNFGIGIETGELQEVFKAGVRGSLAKRENVFGSGLGLTDIRDAMGRHGGRAYIDSELQYDQVYLTTLTLVFPRHSVIRRHYGAFTSVDRRGSG